MKKYKNLAIGLLAVLAIVFSYLKYTDSDIIKQCEVNKFEIEIVSYEPALLTVRGRSNCKSSNIDVVVLDSRKLLLAKDFEKLHERSFKFDLTTSSLPKGCEDGNIHSFCYTSKNDYDLIIDEDGFPKDREYPSLRNELFNNKAYTHLRYECELYLSFKF